MKLHLDTVLDSKRKSLLDKFAWTKDYWFYLAWWTALSLMYGHRKSEDFDFFKVWVFDINRLKDQLNRQWFEYRVTYQVPNTLYISVDGVKISFIWVKKLTLIYPLISTPYFDIASDKEIGIMKLITIPARRELLRLQDKTTAYRRRRLRLRRTRSAGSSRGRAVRFF